MWNTSATICCNLLLISWHDILYFYWTGNYLKFYNAIRQAYPDIQMISNCDGSSTPLDHPADLYDFHVKLLLQVYLYQFSVYLFNYSFPIAFS